MSTSPPPDLSKKIKEAADHLAAQKAAQAEQAKHLPADLKTEHAAHAEAQHLTGVGPKNVQMTISAQQNPQYLSDLNRKAHPTINEQTETVRSIDKSVDREEVAPMVAAAKAKSADGVRTEFDLSQLPSSGVMKDFESWKSTIKKDANGNLHDSLGDFHSYEDAHHKDQANQGDRQKEDRQLIYLQAMDEQMKQMGKSGLKNDITLGLGNLTQEFQGHTTAGHVDTNDPGVRAYLADLSAKAAMVGKEAADNGAARIEIGNEPNDARNMGKQTNGELPADAKVNADRYGLVEGKLYQAIKAAGVGDMRVDMAAMMQAPTPGNTKTFLEDMHASQQYYAGTHDLQGHGQQQLMTDETNMHLYATRDIQHGKEHFDMDKARETEAMYAGLQSDGLLPKDATISELGVYEGRLWDSRANHYVEASPDTNAVQASDNYSLLNQSVHEAEHDFNLHGVNMYGYGDPASKGYGPDRDTSITSTGHNDELTFAGIGGRS